MHRSFHSDILGITKIFKKCEDVFPQFWTYLANCRWNTREQAASLGLPNTFFSPSLITYMSLIEGSVQSTIYRVVSMYHPWIFVNREFHLRYHVLNWGTSQTELNFFSTHVFHTFLHDNTFQRTRYNAKNQLVIPWSWTHNVGTHAICFRRLRWWVI